MQLMPLQMEAYFAAVRNNDVDTVKHLLHQEPLLVYSRWRGRGRPDGKMRSLGAEPYNQHTWIDAPDFPQDLRYTSTPLIWSQDDAMVCALIECSADVNAKGSSGEIELLDWFLTPLWRAAHDGRMKSVRRLVEHGADVNFLNPDGTNQALMTAIENGAIDVVDYLLANGAHPDVYSAAMLGLVDVIAQHLHSNPSCFGNRDSHGRCPLDAATLSDSFRVPWTQTEAHDRVADLLIAEGATVDLDHAASLGWMDWIKQRAETEADILRWKRPVAPLLTGAAEFETPVAAARRRGHHEIVAFLHSHIADEAHST